MYRIYLALILCGFSSHAYSQNPVILEDTTYRSNEARVVVFDTPPEDEGKVNLYPNLITLNVLPLFAGSATLNYERKLSKKNSAAVGAGITYLDYVIIYDLEDPFYSDTINRSFHTGYSFSLGMKHYFSSSIDKAYISPQIWIRRFNSTATAWKEPVSYREHTNLTDIKFSFGYVHLIGKRFILDYFIGVGLRFRSFGMLKYDYEYDPWTGMDIKKGIFESDKEIVPVFSLGLKMGIPF